MLSCFFTQWHKLFHYSAGAEAMFADLGHFSYSAIQVHVRKIMFFFIGKLFDALIKGYYDYYFLTDADIFMLSRL